MNGWLIQIDVPGLEPDTRPMREHWVVAIGDEHEALAKLQEVSGGTNSSVIIALNAQTLAGFGVTESGTAARVKAVF